MIQVWYYHYSQDYQDRLSLRGVNQVFHHMSFYRDGWILDFPKDVKHGVWTRATNLEPPDAVQATMEYHWYNDWDSLFELEHLPTSVLDLARVMYRAKAGEDIDIWHLPWCCVSSVTSLLERYKVDIDRYCITPDRIFECLAKKREWMTSVSPDLSSNSCLPKLLPNHP